MASSSLQDKIRTDLLVAPECIRNQHLLWLDPHCDWSVCGGLVGSDWRSGDRKKRRHAKISMSTWIRGCPVGENDALDSALNPFERRAHTKSLRLGSSIFTLNISKCVDSRRSPLHYFMNDFANDFGTMIVCFRCSPQHITAKLSVTIKRSPNGN